MSHTASMSVSMPEGRSKSEEEDLTVYEKTRLSIFLLLVQSSFIVLFGVFLRYGPVALPNYPVWMNVTTQDENGTTRTELVYQIDPEAKIAHDQESKEHIPINYALYQDVHVMMFVGFGFLMTFLYRYGLSSVTYNLLLGAICIQFATLTDGWIRRLRLQGGDYYIYVTISTMINNDFAIASTLISFGAVLGKVNLLQLAIMGLFEIALYNTNCLFVYDLLKADDPGCSMVVHTFGAYFGLTVSRIIYHKDVKTEAEKKESSVYHSDIFAMIGTLFLWTLYPSFNAATAVDEGKIRGIINTYYSLTAAVVTSFAVTALVNNSKFSMVHIQNSTLAGGVAIGTIAQLIIEPWAAVLVGSLSGVVSVLGFQYLSPFLKRKFGLHDTCGVHNLHGMPGLMAALGSVLAGGLATHEKYSDGLLSNPFNLRIWNLMRYNKNIHLTKIYVDDKGVRYQAGMQAAALGTTLGTAIIGGIIVGVILRIPIWGQPRHDAIMDDEPHWTSVVDIPNGFINKGFDDEVRLKSRKSIDESNSTQETKVVD